MKKVKFAIPAGSLSKATFNILQRAGYNISGQERTYRPTINDPKIEAEGSFATKELGRGFAAKGGIMGAILAEQNFNGTPAFGPDGQTALSSGFDNTIILWDLRDRNPVRSFLNTRSYYSLCIL